MCCPLMNYLITYEINTRFGWTWYFYRFMEFNILSQVGNELGNIFILDPKQDGSVPRLFFYFYLEIFVVARGPHSGQSRLYCY